MEYMTEKLLEQVCQEITTESIGLLMSHSLIKAQAKDYVRASQVRVVLEVLVAQLHRLLITNKQIESKLKQILFKLQKDYATLPGYGAGNLINLLRQCQIDLTSYDFSELAVWQAYLQDINLHDVNFTNADLARSVFTQTLGGILSVAFSPDGKLLVTGDTNGQLCLWQVVDGKQLLTCLHGTWIWAVAFSPDGTKLASGSQEPTVKLWDVRTGQCLSTLHGHSNTIISVSFSPDGHTLASCGAEPMVRLWDVRIGESLRTLEGHTGYVRSIAFSPNGTTLASGGSDASLKLWDVSQGLCCQTLQGHCGEVWSIAFNREGTMLASGSSDKTIKLWHLPSGLCHTTLQGDSDWVHTIAYASQWQ